MVVREPAPTPECPVKVVTILFILWFIVFAFWLVRQFGEHNKRTDKS